MDWIDLQEQGKIIQVKEQVYRGVKCTWVENKGWKISLGAEEYLFPYFQDARLAIDRIHEDCVHVYGARKMK